MKNAGSASGSSKSQMLPSLLPLPASSKCFSFHKNLTASSIHIPEVKYTRLRNGEAYCKRINCKDQTGVCKRVTFILKVRIIVEIEIETDMVQPIVQCVVW